MEDALTERAPALQDGSAKPEKKIHKADAAGTIQVAVDNKLYPRRSKEYKGRKRAAVQPADCAERKHKRQIVAIYLSPDCYAPHRLVLRFGAFAESLVDDLECM